MKKNILTKIETIDFPSAYGKFLLTTYQTKYKDQENMCFALVIQTPVIPTIPIVRVQSECLFSEVFSSQSCECENQLKRSLKLIAKKGGLFFYLDQEGRGHNIFNKTRELKLQQLGFDTVDASLHLKLKPDTRSYDVVADILKRMNIGKIRLITNNPDKISSLKRQKINIVERIILPIKKNEYNYKYLEIKKNKLGHLINLESLPK